MTLNLLAVIKDKDARINKLQSPTNDLEQYYKTHIHGIESSHICNHTDKCHMYPTLPSTQHSDNNDSATMSKNVVSFAKEKLGTIPQPYDITAIHDLSPRRDGTRPVIVQLLSAEKKATLMNKRGSLRCTSVYLNDHLSAFNSELFRQARQLKHVLLIHEWLLLYNWYNKLNAVVKWNGSYRKSFCVTRGTRQGNVLSPYLLKQIINQLLLYLKTVTQASE